MPDESIPRQTGFLCVLKQARVSPGLVAVGLFLGLSAGASAGRPPGKVEADELGVPSWAEMSWLDNGQVRVGVDLKHGGALVFLSRGGGKNRVNNYDFGRQVQLSFYAGPVPYAEAGQEPAPHCGRGRPP